jgi:lipopolysaccharide/colanic/teichoic acid biosynthesis glycosyltransferase
MTDTLYSTALGRYADFGKRTIDLSIASLLLLAVLPIILLAALFIRLTSRGPAFAGQPRLGRFGQPFQLVRLRTRRVESQEPCARGSFLTDPRMTRVGALLKAMGVDALPALWNVIKGEMSLVGPKPERPERLPLLEMSIQEFSQRMLVRPGVIGLAQVCLPLETGLPGIRRRVAHDLHYIRRMNLWLDLRLILAHALLGVGVSREQTRAMLALPAPERRRVVPPPAPAAELEPTVPLSA